MDYSKLGVDLVKIEKIEEKKEEDAVAGKTDDTGSSKPASAALTPPQRECARAVSSFIRRGLCNGIAKTTASVLRWKMDGYADRVDSDPIVCDAFHAVAEKHLPRAIVASPEAVAGVGLFSHAAATHAANVAKERAERAAELSMSYADYAPVNDGIYVSADEYAELSDSVASSPVVHRPSIYDDSVADIDIDDFGFKNKEGEFVDPPKSIMDSLLTGRKRGPRGPRKQKETQPRKKRQKKNNDVDDSVDEEARSEV